LVKVARALAQTPRILLLDEPTAHLDLANQAMILRILRRLALTGTTLILTTHDPNMATAVADFVVLMRQGQILAAGPVDDMLSSEHLSATYGLPVQVATLGDHRAILFQ
jgi:iron complex transport system ATP-binding protein